MQGNIAIIPAYLQFDCKYAGIIAWSIVWLSFLNIADVYLKAGSKSHDFIYI